MSNRTVSIGEMAEAINEGLEEYADLAADEMKAAVKKTAKSVKEEISAAAPSDTGAYAKSWATKATLETSGSLEMTVYSKNKYQLAHLLEKGHALRQGGRAKAYPHIAPAEAVGETLLVQLIEKALS
ncbi:MAG: HK97 gp10 family phage protein [Oscillospiraceae bacterium]|nr:HK97 gp10 family phage protein [Oscillospiraceae bacterium]